MRTSIINICEYLILQIEKYFKVYYYRNKIFKAINTKQLEIYMYINKCIFCNWLFTYHVYRKLLNSSEYLESYVRRLGGGP